MKIRVLALTLALGFALTGVAEAKKKPSYHVKTQHARKANVRKFKATKHKASKLQVKRLKRT
jgi:hypothetical protein